MRDEPDDLLLSPARSVFEEAERALLRGEQAHAVTLLRQAVALDPQHHVAWERLFDQLRDGPDAAGAAEACAGFLASRAVGGHEGTSRTLQCALAHREAGRLADAEAFARVSVDLAGGRLEPAVTLSGILLERGDFDGVVTLLADRVRERGGDIEASALNNLGLALSRLERHEEGISAYRQALAINAMRVDLLVNLYDTLSEVGRQEEAREVLVRAQAVDADHPAVQRRLEDP